MKNKYFKGTPPKAGVVANSIGVFSLKGKEVAERQLKTLFEEFRKEGYISEDSFLYPQRIFSPEESRKVSDLFTKKRVEVIVVLNSAFPNGNTFLALATDPYLFKIPLIVTAPPEIKLPVPEWTTNAFCGVIMNNFVAKRINRYIYPLAGWPKEKGYQNELKRLLKVFYAVRELRKNVIGRFGDAPGGFHSASGDQLTYAERFGTQIETIDLTAVMETYRSRKAVGYLKEVKFSEKEVEETTKEMKQGRVVLVEDEMIRKAARLYHAFKAIIEANGLTSAAFRCWPEMLEPYIGIPVCLPMGWLLSKKVVTAASCEGDWPTAVTQTMGTLLSDKPAACVDFVNYIGGSPIVQLGHCGMGIAGLMAKNPPKLSGKISSQLKKKIMTGKIRINDAIAEKSSDRQGGLNIGPAHIGQFKYGKKTGIGLIQTKEGRFKMLVFTGESSPETAKGILYSAADIKVKNPQRLNDLILEHGFSHHLALTFDDISQELKVLCDYYEIEYISP